MSISDSILNSRVTDSVLNTSRKDDLRQAFVVCGNELVKHKRSKKLVIYLAIWAALVGLMVAIPMFFGDGDMKDKVYSVGYNIISSISMILVVMATIFSSTAIASEYEERTALILLTKPIKKISIMTGKYLASVIIGTITMIVTYAIGSVLMVASGHDVNANIGASILLCFLYILMISAISMLVSAFAKKTSTATVLILFTFLFITSLVESLITVNTKIDCWWMLAGLNSAISGALSDGFQTGRAAIAMVAWTVLGLVGAQQIFKRRQF